MNKKCALLYCDSYKECHPVQLPDGITRFASYWVPRRSMLKQNKMVFFGLQVFIRQYLCDIFDKEFFAIPESEVKEIYQEAMLTQFGKEIDMEHIIKLHRLGYLPLHIRAIPEGTLVPMGVPCIEIVNTRPEFAWLTQWIECILQVELWKPCLHATIGHMYYQVAKKYYAETTDGAIPEMACSDFGMRGMSCLEEAMRTSASWLLSFNKTSTIPALAYIDKYYDADCRANGIGRGAISTEHSVMCSNRFVDGDEITFVRRLLTEIYPNDSFSMVSDSFDYWNMVDNILPSLKEEIMNHNGKLLVRPDSGNIVDISVKTVEKLWDNFGGYINKAGYKVLDPHIGIIYGDGCTLSNVETIWRELKEKGFAANNILFGVGAFCFNAIVEDDRMIVATRDTFGIAMKATWCEVNGKSYPIYKDPKTDTSKLKKSHRGCCAVYECNGELMCADGYEKPVEDSETLLVTVFKDGKIYNESNFMEIRNRLKAQE